MDKCIIYTHQPHNLNNFNKSKFASFKTNAIKHSSKPLNLYNNHSSFYQSSPTKVKDVSLNCQLPQINQSSKKPKVNIEQLNFSRKKYKKDSNSSLSNQYMTSVEKSSLQSNDSVTYETTTTVDDRKSYSKISVFFQIEKATLLIQKAFRSFRSKKIVIKMLKDQRQHILLFDNMLINKKSSHKSLHLNDQLDNSFTSVRSKVSNISINSNDLDLSDEEYDDDIEINENDL